MSVKNFFNQANIGRLTNKTSLLTVKFYFIIYMKVIKQKIFRSIFSN
jgi:hypothetical protein